MCCREPVRRGAPTASHTFHRTHCVGALHHIHCVAYTASHKYIASLTAPCARCPTAGQRTPASVRRHSLRSVPCRAAARCPLPAVAVGRVRRPAHPRGQLHVGAEGPWPIREPLQSCYSAVTEPLQSRYRADRAEGAEGPWLLAFCAVLFLPSNAHPPNTNTHPQ